MLRASWRLAGDKRSYVRLAADTFIYRLLKITHVGQGRRRRIRLSDGTVLTYRADRGDIRAIAETWLARAYDLPVGVAPGGVILDLGANIGITAVFLARLHQPSTYIAVEPVAGNVELARLNLAENQIPARVIEAAVGPRDGLGSFVEAADSTLGQLGEGGRSVKIVSVDTALEGLDPEARITLVKMDIEGAEAALFSANLQWLRRVDCLVAELHPDFCDVEEALRKLSDAGFVEHRLEVRDQAENEYMAYFTRPGPSRWLVAGS